jgi:hypothetical protein
MHPVKFPPLILAELTPKVVENWPNFAKIGAQKPITGRISAHLDDVRPKLMAENKLRTFDRV